MTTAALDSETLADVASHRPDPAAADGVNAHDDALRSGTRLHEFELQRVLGIGGFGIVYLALDHELLRQVAIKEYMPAELARRGSGSAQVSMRSTARAETFASGLHSFLKEAQLLARFDHPSLVKVHRYWEANGTAYMAMQYYPGRTLKEVRKADSTPPDEAGIRRLVEPLLGVLEVLHEQGVYHRDISPDNILLLPDGCPVLLDFGAARRVIGDRTQALTAVLKPSFAPVEQYGDVPGMRQGPWTDLYALGAVVHFVLTGRQPVPAVVRAMHDHMPALSAPEPAVAGISTSFLAAIDWTLGVRPQEWPPSVQALREALAGTRLPPPPTLRLTEEAADEGDTADDAAQDTGEVCAEATAATQRTDVRAKAADAAAAWQSTVRHERERAPAEVPAEAPPHPAATLRRAITGTAMALVAAVGLGVWALGSAGHGNTAQRQGERVSMQPEHAGEHSAALRTAPAAQASDPPSSATPFVGAPAVGHTETHPAQHTDKATSPVAARPDPVSHRQAATPTPPATRHTANNAARPTPTAAVAPASPRAACGDRNFLAMSMCLNRRCLEPAFQRHPQCLELKAYEERRRQEQMNR